MHRYAAWGLTALAAGTGLPATAADPVKPADKPSLVARWFGGSDPKPAAEKTFADVVPRPPVVVGPMDPVVQAEALKAETEAWSRRISVCLKLQQLALELNDDKLLQQADDLERQVHALYHQRTARLGVKAPRRSAPDGLDRAPGADVAGALPSVPPPEPADEPRQPPATRARDWKVVKP